MIAFCDVEGAASRQLNVSLKRCAADASSSTVLAKRQKSSPKDESGSVLRQAIVSVCMKTPGEPAGGWEETEGRLIIQTESGLVIAQIGLAMVCQKQEMTVLPLLPAPHRLHSVVT